jgi:aspartate/methionine/tyrosine aminotransferase
VLTDFRLETYFSRWEFKARYHLTASDAQTVPMATLLDLADDDARERWESLTLGYTETHGLPALREAIANTYTNVEPDQVLCFAGAEEGLYLAMRTLLEPTDHVLVVTPDYQAAETVPLSICEVTGIPLGENWALDVDEVARRIRPNTRLVSVNFPNNPTGALPDPATWQRLTDLCQERGILLFSDEVYRGLEETPLPQAADVSPTALSLNVMSKAYGLPGLRIGWIACQDREILDRLERAKHYTSICNSAPSEVLALIALRARDQILQRNREIVATNIPLFNDFFSRHPDLFDWQPPRAGCVCFPRYLGGDVEKMCTDLVEQAGILLLPASVYQSALTPTPTDRFRVGVGRQGPEQALARWSEWLATPVSRPRTSPSRPGS